MNIHRSSYRAPLAALALAALLLTGCSIDHDDDDHLPRCPAVRNGSVDTVPAGRRPCVLYSNRTSPTPGRIATQLPASGSATTRTPNGTSKQSSAPKASAAPKNKVR